MYLLRGSVVVCMRLSYGMQSSGRRKGGKSLSVGWMCFVYVSEVAVLRADRMMASRSVVATKGIVARMQ